MLVSAGEGFSASVLEAASRFTAQHPGCSVELQVTTDFHKIVRGVADIAIRTAHLGEPSLIYRGLGELAYGVFATAEYLQRFPALTPATAASIALLPPLDLLPQMRAAKAAGLDRAPIRVSSFAVQLESVRRGMGVAVLPRILAMGLSEVFVEIELPAMEVLFGDAAAGVEGRGIFRGFLGCWRGCCGMKFLAWISSISGIHRVLRKAQPIGMWRLRRF